MLVFFCFFFICLTSFFFFFFFFNDTATTEIYTLSLHDALPISPHSARAGGAYRWTHRAHCARSEEHTSELQSRENLVCRLLLEKKKKKINKHLNKKKKEKKKKKKKKKYKR